MGMPVPSGLRSDVAPGMARDSRAPGSRPDLFEAAARPVEGPSKEMEPIALEGRLEVDGTPGRPMTPGVPAAWTFHFLDPEGRPATEFEVDHEKPMHLVAVSQDLETFAHLHPSLGPDGGFRIFANQGTCDPDNADAARAVVKSGAHHLFASVRPAGVETQLYRFDVEASGEPHPVPPAPDPQVRPGTIRKYFDSAGQEAPPGAAYEVTLQIEDHRRHGMFHLEFLLRRAVADGQGGVAYEDVREVEPWLGAPGHAVMIGAAGESAADRFFGHLHAGGHGSGHAAPPVVLDGEHPPGGGLGPSFRFAAPHGELPPAGLYKVWGQFKDQGSVGTFPFVFELD